MNNNSKNVNFLLISTLFKKVPIDFFWIICYYNNAQCIDAGEEYCCQYISDNISNNIQNERLIDYHMNCVS